MADNVNVIPRTEWGAMSARMSEHMNTPVNKVLFSAENEFGHCNTRESCTQMVRDIQKHYMDQGMDDIPYNFVVGNDGNVYEGRGWNYKPSPAVRVDMDFEDYTIDIGVICGHKDITPTNMDMVRDSFKGAEVFVKYGIQQKMVTEDYAFRGFTDEIKPSAPVAKTCSG